MKIATLGGAVLAMIVYMVLDGQAVPLPQILIFGTLTAISLGLMGRFLVAISPESDPVRAETSPDSEVEA